MPDRCRLPQNGWTPLHHGVVAYCAEVVKQLLSAGADVEAQDLVREEGGRG